VLEELHREGATIVMVTHDPELAARAQREVHIVDGQIVDIEGLSRAMLPPHTQGPESGHGAVSAYFLQLALQNLKRHVWLTALIVLVISLGLGSSMTVYSILRAMSADPIPWKSDRLLTVQIDNLGPDNRRNAGRRSC
jgi:energy-coupling factor transporter ATP-binding protein EcfA2